MKDKKMVNLSNARPGKYTETIKKISEGKMCPFCKEHLYNIHPNHLDERKYWIITDNAYPYSPKKHHILLIHKKHIDHAKEITADAWKELHSIINELSYSKNIEGGTFMLRFGESKFTGATVTHLHAHIFQSDPDDPTYESKRGVMTRVG